MENAVEIKNLTKVYELYEKPVDRLKEVIIKNKSYHKDFYALNNITFDVSKGESFGIIGVNGSGKSTLLKIITGVVSKTKGDLIVNGKISALLELGAGFNMEYTGIENIFLNGSMMGFSKKYMEEKLPTILQFADIGEFINFPVKKYSSGMFVRLAFALNVMVEPDILIVDEALSVGDIFFQNKCYKRMEELKNKGVTIIIVTHDMGAILKYCERVLLLNKGEQIKIGSPHDVIDIYKKILVGKYDDNDKKGNEEKNTEENVMKLVKNEMAINKNAVLYGDNAAEFLDFGIIDKNNKPITILVKGEEFIIYEKIKINKKIKSPIFTWTIKDKRGVELTGTNTMLEKIDIGDANVGEIFEIKFTQKMRLQGGEYLLSMSCTSFEQETLKVHARMYDIISLNVLINDNKVGVFDSESKVSITHYNSEVYYE